MNKKDKKNTKKNNRDFPNSRPEESLLNKLEGTNIYLDYSDVLMSAMGQWFPVEALSLLEELFEDGIIGPGKISDDMVDALDMMFSSSYPKKSYEVLQKTEDTLPSQKNILGLVEELKKKGCRFYENLIFSVMKTPLELTTIEVTKRLAQGEVLKDIDIVTQDGYGYTVFDVHDLESIDKYGLPRTEKEFLEDKVLSELIEEDILVEKEKIKLKPLPPRKDKSAGDYLDSGGVLFLKRPQGGFEEIRTREQLWDIEPSLMARNRKEFLGNPTYKNLVRKIN